jgi:hypothetical protein
LHGITVPNYPKSLKFKINNLMKHVMRFSDFLNEGAKLSPPNYNSVELEWFDEKRDPLEVFKTNASHNVAGFKKMGITSEGAYQIYYGLAVDPSRRDRLSNSDPVLKKTMDLLKSANIEGGEEALRGFTKKTASVIKQNKQTIDYIVSLGSTQGLSAMLGRVFATHFPEAKLINLEKYQFENIVKAIKWDYVSTQGEAVLTRVKNSVIREIDRERTPDFANVRRKIIAAKTEEELQNKLDIGNPDGVGHQIVWKTPNFVIRSSGVSHGGSRQWMKTKYDTPKPTGEKGSIEFVNAVIDCIKGGKTMLYVDDNARTRGDLSDLFDFNEYVITNAQEYGINPEQARKSKYWKRFLAYVLIYVPDLGAQDITVKKLIDKDSLQVFSAEQDYLANIEAWKEGRYVRPPRNRQER